MDEVGAGEAGESVVELLSEAGFGKSESLLGTERLGPFLRRRMEGQKKRK